MRKINRKGFTLIELLAVIVVLAIVMVLAASTILPYMANARKDAFAVEANTLKESAAQAMSLKAIGSVKDNFEPIEETVDGKTVITGYCFTVENLKNLGLFKKDDTNYAGTVIVDISNSAYTYTVNMKNTEFYVTKTGDVEREDVGAIADIPETFAAECE